MKKDITLIIGPTGVGKTELSLDHAQKTGAEIISTDAFQVYQGLDIGTAKVPATIRKTIPHHLIDIKTVDQSYSVAEFMTLAELAINDIRSRNKPILMCGGTAFYTYAFLYQYSFPDQKGSHHIEIQDSENLWEKLNSIDPAAASAIHPNNKKRLQRALMIIEQTGELPSKLKQKSELPRNDVATIGLEGPRDKLYTVINHRVETMIEKGLIDEVEQLIKQGVSEQCPAFQAIGYKETIDYLNGLIDKPTLISTIQQHSRNYAKRQLTWYRKFEQVTWLPAKL